MHTKKSKQIKQRKSHKKYRGDGSPYRDYLSSRGDFSQEHDMLELSEANADKLPESAGLWYRAAATEQQEDLMLFIFSQLTPKQQEILSLVGLQGKTYDHAAVILGIKKSTVQKTIERIRHKFASLNEA